MARKQLTPLDMTGNPINGLPLTPTAENEAVAKAWTLEAVNTDKITVSADEPTSPQVGDIWIDSDEEAGNAASLDGFSIQGIFDSMYPIGSAYTNYTNGTNPKVLLNMPWSTWVAKAGRVVVGIDPTQTEFDTIGETGGSKTHTLSEAEMPSHTHGQYVTANSGPYGRKDFQAEGPSNRYDQGVQTMATGGNQPHNNLQPYVVAYVWERTA